MRNLWFLILTSLFVYTENTTPYNPNGRIEFISELLSDKIYYYGGHIIGAGNLDDFFYIDLTQPFSGSSPPYQLIKNLDANGGASSVSYANKIYVFGGFNINGSAPPNELIIIQSITTDPVILYVKDTISAPSSRKWHVSVVDHINQKIYVQDDGTMYIFDISQYAWTSNPTPNQPNGRQLHTATLLPDGRIIMIGGAFSSDIGQHPYLQCLKLDVYDTKTNQWFNITATKNGYIPPIISHSATLLPDNQSVLIYGGSDQAGYSGLAVLNTSNYVWTVISPTGNAPSIISSGHKATLYFDIIIFAFGQYTVNNKRYLMNSEIRILNIINGQYRWIDSYIPHSIINQTQKPSTQSPIPQNSNSNTNIIIGFAVGGTIGLGILVSLGYIICLLKKRNLSMESAHEIR
ncbi:22798_t:CDS:2 [Gigaspora margarita]|uniref:22798_t:CDS:1 n=1 Tax=Gigaspora margarita TaxID=4874 RepID=A0ABN7WL08_GIGMA|nr:22798_t:CDS:2 [Gigaspora margarita]